VDYGVKVVVCGQSLVKREIPKEMLIPGIEVAASALTTITTYQLKGYALLRF
jgi:intracellular sulfur oxidation DsrE/DsrF family protein